MTVLQYILMFNVFFMETIIICIGNIRDRALPLKFLRTASICISFKNIMRFSIFENIFLVDLPPPPTSMISSHMPSCVFRTFVCPVFCIYVYALSYSTKTKSVHLYWSTMSILYQFDNG